MRLIDADAIPWNVDGVGEIPVITKEEIDRLPTVDAIVLNPSILKLSKGGYILYKREWLYRHLEQEFNILARVSGQPTVKAEPEHGHWIINGEWCTCSECKQRLHYERSKGKSNLINALSMAVNFCPNCGAKMDEKVTRGTE